MIFCQFSQFIKLKRESLITLTPHKNELDNLNKPRQLFNPDDHRLKKKMLKIKSEPAAKTQKNNDEDTICLYCNDINWTFLKS